MITNTMNERKIGFSAEMADNALYEVLGRLNPEHFAKFEYDPKEKMPYDMVCLFYLPKFIRESLYTYILSTKGKTYLRVDLVNSEGREFIMIQPIRYRLDENQMAVAVMDAYWEYLDALAGRSEIQMAELPKGTLTNEYKKDTQMPLWKLFKQTEKMFEQYFEVEEPESNEEIEEDSETVEEVKEDSNE